MQHRMRSSHESDCIVTKVCELMLSNLQLAHTQTTSQRCVCNTFVNQMCFIVSNRTPLESKVICLRSGDTGV